MAWNPFSKIINALFGGPYRIGLKREPDHFELAFFKGKKPVNPTIILKKFKLEAPEALPIEKTSAVLSPAQIEEVVQFLEGLSFKRLNIEIDDVVKNLRKTAPPDGPLVHFTLSNESGRIVPVFTENMTCFSDGWFVDGDRYWQLSGITPDDESWLSQDFSKWKDIEKFILEIVPDWRCRGLPFLTSIEIVNEPALSISLQECTEKVVVFDCQWKVPPETLRENPLSSAHVISDSRIMPGIVPSRLPESFRKSGITRLEKQAIPAFRKNVWPHVKSWATGQIEAFEQVHRLLEGKGKLILTIEKTEQEGIGKVTAIPKYKLGDLLVDAETLSRKIQPSVDFLRMEKAWLPMDSPKSVGIGPMGRMSDGTPIESFDLKPHEILIRDSSRFRGHWSKVDFHSISLPQPSGSALSETGEQHLEFLKTWGIPGGLIGSPESLTEVFQKSLASFVRRYPDFRILAIGSRRTLDSISIDSIAAIRLNGIKKDPGFDAHLKGLVAATPKALETTPGLVSLKWDVLCVFEADTLIKSGSSKLFKNLCDCKRRLVIGQFSDKAFLEKNQSKEALSQVFQNNWPLVWKYSLRDPLKGAEKLPEPRQPQPLQIARPVQPAEMQIGSPTHSAGVPIPPRPQPSVSMIEQKPRASSIDMEDYGIRIEVRYSSGEDSFVEKAKQLVSHKERSAHFVPFMSYWPTYDSMTQAQLKWYFFWRGQVRQEKYPDTDLSYIFVHVYELINNIGVKSPQDGYKQLYRLWTNYRERYAKLDNYLIDWITDYILINKCQVDPFLPVQEAAKSGSWVADPNAVLPQYIDGSLAEMPLSLLDCLTDYRIRSSKFYLAGNQQLLEGYCPQTVDRVDKYWRKKGGVGLFEAFRPRSKPTTQRRAYVSAVYAGPQAMISLPSFVPYSQHPPLRQFLTGIVKHTENKLREVKNYKGKLRGYTLEPDVLKVIESLIDGTTDRIVPSPPKPKVEIDVSRVEDLIRESDEVREMLVGAEVTEKAPEQQPVSDQGPILPDYLTCPVDTPDHLLTDLDGVYQLLSRLDQNEKNLIDKLTSAEWEKSDSAISEEMPGIFIESLVDRINGLAVELLGDILIVSEGGQKIVEDDYRDELEFIVTQEAAHAGSTEPSQLSELSEGWDSFAAQITPYQYTALKIINEGENVNEELQRIAEENALMPETLIDCINELALDTVGDVIIEPGSNPPIIEDEDIEAVKMVLQLKG
jgi:hypothetical protein